MVDVCSIEAILKKRRKERETIQLDQPDLVHVRLAERRVALGTFALPRIVARFETVVAEDVKTLGENGVALLVLARRTAQDLFVFADLLEQHFVFVRGHLQFTQAFQLAIQILRLFL